jgi:hypothetical protein
LDIIFLAAMLLLLLATFFFPILFNNEFGRAAMLLQGERNDYDGSKFIINMMEKYTYTNGDGDGDYYDKFWQLFTYTYVTCLAMDSSTCRVQNNKTYWSTYY